ncbi:hypothetical protein BDR06DRAFT_577669 [Suillus hirtellus]|nr:hypothetical protein BDR06DRAFT_577669 [Suillus hirtellus]
MAILAMQQEIDIQPDSGPAFPSDTVSSSSMTNFGAQHRPRSPRSTAQHRRHPYSIPRTRSSTQRLRTIREDSSFRTDAGVDGPSTADQREFTDTSKQSPLTTPNVAPSTRLITSALVPDLTSLIIRRSPYPISCGAYGDVYRCTYRGPEGDAEVAVKAMRPGCVDAEVMFHLREWSYSH